MFVGVIIGLVLDTFLITSCNKCSVKENLKTYLGIETVFAIVGCILGSIILMFLSASLFKSICALIILVLQLIDVVGFKYPDKINALLLGADSLVVFANLSWIYIPVLTVCEFLAIVFGSTIGAKFVCKLPMVIQEYASNVVMICIAICLLLQEVCMCLMYQVV